MTAVRVAGALRSVSSSVRGDRDSLISGPSGGWSETEPSAGPTYFAILRSRSSAIVDPQHAAWHVDRGRDHARDSVRSGRLLPRASSGSQFGPAPGASHDPELIGTALVDFASLDLLEPVMRGIREAGFVTTTPI